MKGYARTDIGKTRRENQDAYYLPKAGERFALVADGMGGHRAGDVASGIAVTEMMRWLRLATVPGKSALAHAVQEANKAIYQAAKEDPLKAGMGTTLTAVWMDGNTVLLAHVGDSRAYLYRNGALMQMTRDHSLVAELLERGEITYEQSLTHPQRNYITRAVGTAQDVEPDILSLERQEGDIWFLCTDGLSNAVTSPEIARILNGQETWQTKLDTLVSLALERGGRDNITAMVITDEEDPA